MTFFVKQEGIVGPIATYLTLETIDRIISNLMNQRVPVGQLPAIWREVEHWRGLRQSILQAPQSQQGAAA